MRSFRIHVFVAAAIVGGAGPLTAQSMEPGLLLSFNTTTFSGEANTDFDYRTSFGGGVSLAFTFPNGLAIQPELRYVVKGATSDSAIVNNSEVPLRVKSTISYLEIPVLLVYTFDLRGPVKPRIFAGPYFASKLEASIEWEPRGGGLRQRNADGSVESIDLGFVAGGAVEFNIAGERTVLGVRGMFGRSDVRGRPDAPLRNTGAEIFAALVFQ